VLPSARQNAVEKKGRINVGERRKIMVVEGSAHFRAVYKDILKDAYEVFPLESAQKLFALLQHVTPDLILLAVAMPDMSGYDAVKKLQTEQKTKNIPVALLPEESDAPNAFESLSLGAIACIPKPINAAPFRARVENHLKLLESADRIAHNGYTRASKDEAAALVVDDNPVNLTVAEVCLSAFGVKTDTALSGIDAVERVQQKHYDIVFMDYVMPQMDGAETAKRIRELASHDPWLGQVPIIALSANEQKESAVESCMNDFMQKPMDSQKLNRILLRWLSKDKARGLTASMAHNENDYDAQIFDQLQKIKGLDTASGLFHIAQNRAGYIRVIAQFAGGFEQYRAELLRYCELRDWANYAIRAHALKGVLAALGAQELSQAALELESAAQKRDSDSCVELTEPFCAKLTEFWQTLNAIPQLKNFEKNSRAHETKKIAVNAAAFKTKLLELKTACAVGSVDTAEKIARELESMDAGKNNQEAMRAITSLIFSFDYDEVIQKIDILLNMET
jgi:CheY-like chemotaxis protein